MVQAPLIYTGISVHCPTIHTGQQWGVVVWSPIPRTTTTTDQPGASGADNYSSEALIIDVTFSFGFCLA